MAGPINPITLAMIGAVGGAALKPNNPLQGALLGATAGYTGGTALGVGAPAAASGGGLTMGAGGANAAKLGVETTGLSTGIGSAVPGTMGVGQGLSIAPTTIGSASNVSSIANATNAANALNAAPTAPEWFGLDAMTLTPKGLTAVPASASLTSAVPGASYSLSAAPSMDNYSLVAPSAVTSQPTPSFMDSISMSGKNAYENPMMTALALNATQGLLTPEQMATAPAVPIKSGRQLNPSDTLGYMDPYRDSVIRNQPISLLG
jgi:hypothetical protein